MPALELPQNYRLPTADEQDDMVERAWGRKNGFFAPHWFRTEYLGAVLLAAGAGIFVALLGIKV